MDGRDYCVKSFDYEDDEEFEKSWLIYLPLGEDSNGTPYKEKGCNGCRDYGAQCNAAGPGADKVIILVQRWCYPFPTIDEI